MSEVQQLAFGTLAIVAIDDALDADALLPEERGHWQSLTVPRMRTWLAGRVALRRALDAIGAACGPVLADERGAPRLPSGVAGSIAHKETVAVALAAHSALALGVDVEYDRPSRVDISRRVLTARELSMLAGLDEARRARAVRVAFSVKEAIYKAIDPTCRRYVGFHEVELDLGSQIEPGAVRTTLHLAPDPGPIDVEAAWQHAHAPTGESVLVATARASRRTAAGH